MVDLHKYYAAIIILLILGMLVEGYYLYYYYTEFNRVDAVYKQIFAAASVVNNTATKQ